MTEPFTGAGPDPAAAGIREQIERLKALEGLISDLLTDDRTGSVGHIMTAMTSPQDVGPPVASLRAGCRRCRKTC